MKLLLAVILCTTFDIHAQEIEDLCADYGECKDFYPEGRRVEPDQGAADIQQVIEEFEYDLWERAGAEDSGNDRTPEGDDMEEGEGEQEHPIGEGTP